MAVGSNPTVKYFMKYISGMNALNLSCSLNTSGDWHSPCYQWTNFEMKESDNSIFGDYGIEKNRSVNFSDQKYNIANHIRAVLDLIESKSFPLIQGFRKDFICTAEYDYEIFNQIYLLKSRADWEDISDFIGKEYGRKWYAFLTEKNNEY